MRRNSKDEKMQRLTKLYNESATLFREDGDKVNNRYRRENRMIWVPVDEPQHIGWEYQLTFSEAAQRRNDIGELKSLMALLKFDKVGFSKSKSTLKLVRSANKRYTEVRNKYQQWRKKGGINLSWLEHDYLPDGIVNIYRTYLTKEKYSLLNDKQKAYFYNFQRFVPATISKDAHYEDRWELTSSKFPFDELRVKVSKCYSTHKGIPKVDELSREAEIDAVLDAEHYRVKRWPRGNYGRWTSFERRQMKRSVRKRWHSILNEAAAHDEPDVIVDYLERKAVNNKY